MKLYTFRHSPNPLKVRLALAEIGAPYDKVEVNLFKGEHRGEEFLKVNPHGKVPVLDDGRLLLPESNAIIAYLGKTRGGALWPTDPIGETKALRWLFFEAAHMMPHAGTVWWSDIVTPKLGRPAAGKETIEEAADELERSLHLLEKRLASRAFMSGDAFSLVDCCVGVTVAMLRGTRLDDAARFPRVTAYRDRIISRPTWAAADGDAIRDIG